MFDIHKDNWSLGFGERNLQWKTTFDGGRPLVEEVLWWRTTFGGRQPLVVTPPLNSNNTTEPNSELLSLSAVSTSNRICHLRKMYAALCFHVFAGKTTLLGKEDKTIII